MDHISREVKGTLTTMKRRTICDNWFTVIRMLSAVLPRVAMKRPTANQWSVAEGSRSEQMFSPPPIREKQSNSCHINKVAVVIGQRH
jgi:hypothetical protein